MINVFKNLTSILKGSAKIKKALYFLLLAFLSLYIFSIPSFSGNERLYIISYIFMVGLGFFALAYLFIYRNLKINKLMFFPLFFVLYAFVGTAFFSREFGRWFTLVLMFITFVIIYYSFYCVGNKRKCLRLFVYAFFAFAVYFALHYRNQIIALKTSDLSYLRIGDDNYFDNVNTLGFYFSIAFALSLYLAIFHKKKAELLFLGSSLLFAVLGIMTGSRSFVIVTAFAIMFILYLKLQNRKLIFFICVGIIIGLFLVLINIPALAFLKEQFDRMLFTLFGIGNSKYDTSTLQRVLWPQYAWYLAGKNMIIGYGCGGFGIYSGVGTYSHNNYSEVICNFGVIGFFAFYSSFLASALYSFKSKSTEVSIVLLVVLIYLVRNFFGVSYYSKDTYLVIALCYYLIHDCSINIFKKQFSSNSVKFYEVNI